MSIGFGCNPIDQIRFSEQRPRHGDKLESLRHRRVHARFVRDTAEEHER